MTEHVHGKRWIEEFRNEIVADRKALADARVQRAGGPWSFEGAVARTKHFYEQRITGFHVCMSITDAERDELMAMVATIGEG
ncbi:MAG: hypothetical protein ACM31L_07525 [Actinomycetota bacterium]